MKINDKYTKILIDETLRETVSHGSEEYPFKYYYEDIWLFDFHCVDWHWHSEVEFVFLEKGKARFFVGSESYDLYEGMGIFINTHVIHRFEAEECAVIPNIVFSPTLLSPKGSLIYQKYILPVLDSSADCIIFSPDVPWQQSALNSLMSVFEIQEKENISEIKTAEILLKLWNTIYENVNIKERTAVSYASAHTQAQLQIMMQYIHKNYFQNISLNDIANTVSLSKSSALNIFNRYLKISPISYLVNYRLKRAATLLTSTENSVYSIAHDTGFENIGYFCRKFRGLYEMTPGEYRKKAKWFSR